MSEITPPIVKGETTEERIDSIRRYLFSLSEKLNEEFSSVKNQTMKANVGLESILNQPEYTENSIKGILWEGALTMNQTQMIFLFDPISDQHSGINLIFSRIVNAESADDDFISYFIPKDVVKKHSGKGFSFPLNNATYAQIGAKYLFIHDDRIVGWHGNEESGTNNGINYNNAEWVLRQVIGV